MVKFKLTWHEEEVGTLELPNAVDTTDRKLLVLCTFNAPQTDPDLVVVAVPIDQDQGKRGIDLSKPVVQIVSREVLETNIADWSGLYFMNWQSAVTSGFLWQKSMASGNLKRLILSNQGSDHSGKASVDPNTGSIEIQFTVSGQDLESTVQFCISGEVYPEGKPVQFTLHVNKESEGILLWEGASFEQGNGICFSGSLRRNAIHNSAKALEKLRWPLYAYEENSWGGVLLALLQTLSETAKIADSCILTVHATFPSRLVVVPHGHSRSFFGPDVPILLGAEMPPSVGAEPSPEAVPKMAAVTPAAGKELQPVQLGVSAPRQAKPGSEFTARFVAYEKALEKEVRDLLTKLAPSAEPVLGIQECRWKRDTRVTVKLSGRGLTVNPPEQEFTWQGGRSLLEFDVMVPKDAEDGTIPLKFDVAIEGIIVALLRLELEITAKPRKKRMFTATGEPARTAFASYSSKDRLRVLDRVDAIQIAAGIDVFQDCLDLNPGEEWKPRLDSEIRDRDLFLLFWSKSASESKWVGWELETALKEKGEQALQLHPLDPGVEPPPGLEKLNIGSNAMWVRKGNEAVLAEQGSTGTK